jgi:hypothetical protein
MLIIILVLLTSGCTNLSVRLQPEDLSVKEVLEGKDCLGIGFGFGFGTSTIERAIAHGYPLGSDEVGYSRKPGTRITKVRRVEFMDSMFLSFGEQCVVVVGEGS